MNVNAAKRRAKNNAILNKIVDEPVLTEENYNSDLNHALGWYNINFDEKKRRKSALEYFAKAGQKAEVIAINRATDFEVRSLGVVCRLASRDQPLSEKHQNFISDTASELVRKYKLIKEVKKAEVVSTPVVSIQERMEELARKHAAEFDGAIDDFITTKTTQFSAKNYLLSNEVSAPVAKRIGEFYVPQLQEIEDAIAGNDDQLVEGYSFLTKKELKKYAEFLRGIVADCQQQVQTAKANRSPRKRKAPPPSKVVARMKFMREFVELKLKSCKPEDILASNELWVYNTKYRKVTVYKAEGGTLSVKGTTILGFDVKNSKTLMLRKPEEFFKGLAMGKRALNGAMKTITTKPTVPNGRINEECILLGAF